MLSTPAGLVLAFVPQGQAQVKGRDRREIYSRLDNPLQSVQSSHRASATH